MLRLLSRSRKAPPPLTTQPAVVVTSQPAAKAPPSPAHTPTRAESLAAELDPETAEAERRDSDEFFTQAIEQCDDDFLLSPEKVTVEDINSIQEPSPGLTGQQRPRVARALAYSSPQSASGSYGSQESQRRSAGGGDANRSLFSASEDDQSWLVAAPSQSGGASSDTFMLEDSPPRRSSGRQPATTFSPSPSRIPSSPSPQKTPGVSRIPKPALDSGPYPNGAHTSPAKGAGSRIPASPQATPYSTAHQQLASAGGYQASPSRLPKGAMVSSPGVREPSPDSDVSLTSPAAAHDEPAAQGAANPGRQQYMEQPPEPQPQAQLQPTLQGADDVLWSQPAAVPAADRRGAAQEQQSQVSVAEQAQPAPAASAEIRPVEAAPAPAQPSKAQNQQQATPQTLKQGCCGCCIM